MAWHDWLTGDRAFRRLEKDLDILGVDADCLEARPDYKDSPEQKAMRELFDHAKKRMDARPSDIEGAWASLHASRRYTLFALTEAELDVKRRVLLLEKEKVSSWRRKAIEKLIDKQGSTVQELVEAMCVFDEYSANQYHKIWLTADQLGILIWTSLISLLFLAPMFLYVHQTWSVANGDTWHIPSWSLTMIFAVLVFGLEGGAFSVAQGLFPHLADDKVPDRVANHWMMLIRAIFGSIAGLAGYTFQQANLLKVQAVVGDGIGVRLAIAFIFGYTGEKLISKVAASFSAQDSKH